MINSITPSNNAISFQACYKSKFSKQLETAIKNNTPDQKLIDEFSKVFQQKKNSKYKIGAGRNGEVFRIDDYYVFKTYFNDQPKIGEVKISQPSIFQTLKTYYGGIVAKFGNIDIIKNVSNDAKKMLEMASSKNNGEGAYKYCLEEFSQLPQSAIDNLAQDFKKLNEIHSSSLNYRFDTNNPNNFIKVGKSIRIVDDIDWVPCKNPNDFLSFINPFIQQGGDANLKKQLLKKCILASEKYQLPMDDAFKYLKSKLDDTFKSVGIKENFEDFYQKMTNLRKNYPNQTERMKLASEYINSL